MIACFVVLGEILTQWTAPNAVVELDTRTAEDLAAGRSASTNELASWSVFLANTPVKIGLSIVLAGLAVWRWRRWYEAALIGVTLAFEATAYFTTSRLVGRPRPDVERLIDSPVDTSFPSGHVAAATVYAVLAIIVMQRTESSRARFVAIALAVLLPIAVAWGRMYQGMHFLSDVVAGTVLGIVSIVICHRILRPHQPETKGWIS
ncbi:MAG: phosphatase PAP2 family protein [Acidimicrobiales bacterium]